jgi:predicted nucleotidyltransferase component of viral defense system
MADPESLYPHAEDRALFGEALKYTEATTGFTATLIEKDYHCSLILRRLFQKKGPLVFRGGTCLSKVHAGFYRLSEDLDLVISVTAEATRALRSELADPLKSSFRELAEAIPGLGISEMLRGYNECKQYIGSLEYESAVMRRFQTIKIEVGLREELLRPAVRALAGTIAVNPFTGSPLLPTFAVNAMSLKEAYAEKFRAAVSRIEPAIRDFFDIAYAVRMRVLDPLDPDFLAMVKSKLEIKGNVRQGMSLERRKALDRQVEGQLRPMLRTLDIGEFDLVDTLELVRGIEKACGLRMVP